MSGYHQKLSKDEKSS